MRTTILPTLLAVLATATFVAPQTPPVAGRSSTAPEITADVLLARWAKAIGGVERLQAVKTTYSRARVEGSEGEGKVEEWCTSHGQRRHESETQSGVETRIFDGRQGWLRIDGQVSPPSEDETRGQRAAAYLGSNSHLVPGRLRGRSEYLGETETDHLLMLRITPEGGRPTLFYLDPSTGLPVRSERELVSTTFVIRYDEWREVDGVRIPWRQVLTTTDSAYTATETLAEIRFNGPLEPGLFARPKEGPSGVRFESSDHVARIPIEIRESHIYFRGRLNDSSVVFSLDTGAPSNVIDEARVSALGVERIGSMRIFGANGSTESARVRGLTVELPGVRMENQSFRTTSLQFLSPPIGLRVDAILGYDVFTRFVVEIDYAGREMRLHDPARYRYQGKGARLPITLRENEPYVRGQVHLPNGAVADGEFVIDVGSGSTLLLAADFAAVHGLPESLPHKLQGRAEGVGGELRTAAGRLPGFQLGPFQVDEPIVQFPAAEISAPGTAGNVGGRLLRRFKVIFDYRQLLMILEPATGFATREEMDMSGLALLAAGPDWSEIRIARVRPHSAGDEAGAKPGDTLERVDGLLASAIGLESVRTMFRLEKSYDLVLRRDDRPVSVTLRTRRQL